MRVRRWRPTASSPRPEVAGTAAGGWCTATRGTGAMCSSRIPTPTPGTRLAGLGCPQTVSCPPSPTPARNNCSTRPAGAALRHAPTPSCGRCCWTCSPPTPRAREAAQTAAATRDRPGHRKDENDSTPAQPLAANVVPFDRDGHARQIHEAIDAERRRRREQAVPVTPPPPPRLGETHRRSSLLVLPPEKQDAQDPPAEAPSKDRR